MGSERSHDVAETAAPVEHVPASTPPAAPLAPIPMPRTLLVGHATDGAEAEADRRADTALARLAPLPATLRRATSTSAVAAVVGRAGGPLDHGTTARIEGRRGGGTPLPARARQRMETAFGQSFGDVRVHADESAARLSGELSAAAFTTGKDIFFGAGRLAPDTPAGERLLAHELAHTLQGPGPIGRFLEMTSDRGKYDGSRWEDQEYYRKAMAEYKDDPLAWSILKWMNESNRTTFVYPDLAAFKKDFAAIMRDVSRAAAGNAARWHVGPFTSPDGDVLRWLPAETLRPKNADPAGTRVNKLIVQTPQERGDMHDVRPAMQFDPQLYVLVHVSDPRQLGDAATIVDYYRDMGDRVFVVAGRTVPGAYSGYAWAASSSTEVLLKTAKRTKGGINARLKVAATGDASTTLGPAYEALMEETFHFTRKLSQQTPFALINFRASGHGITKPRLPSHPELDTGSGAFKQLWDTVRRLGYWPVPTGGDIPEDILKTCEVADGVAFDREKHPHLIEYFRKVGPVEEALKKLPKPPNLSKRQLEYGLIARIKELFPRTRAVGMRSGGLDAFAQAGVPVLSIDLASSHVAGRDTLAPAHGHVNSWMRAAKRELIQPGMFHQVFMTELRELGKLDEKAWDGTLSATDVDRIAFAMDAFFGSDESAGTKRAVLAQQPLPVLLETIPDENNRNLFRKLAKLRPREGLVLDKAMQNGLGLVPFGGKDLRDPPKAKVEPVEGAEGVEAETDEDATVALEKTVVTPVPSLAPTGAKPIVAPTGVKPVEPAPKRLTPVPSPAKSVGSPAKVGPPEKSGAPEKSGSPAKVRPPEKAGPPAKKDVVGMGRLAPSSGPGSTKAKSSPRPTGTPARTGPGHGRGSGPTTRTTPLGMAWPELVPTEPVVPRPVTGPTTTKTKKKSKNNRGGEKEKETD